MLRIDNNRYIHLLYNKSLELHLYQQEQIQPNLGGDDDNYDQEYDDNWNRLNQKCSIEGKQSAKATYKILKKYKVSDAYIFEDNIDKNQQYLTHKESYIPYPRRDALLSTISKAMKYQENNDLVDYHPSLNELDGEIKKQVEEEIQKSKFNMRFRRRYDDDEEDEEQEESIGNTAKIRNVIHQSLQSYHKDLCEKTNKSEINQYFAMQKKRENQLDQWGKSNKCSPSEFLWLPSVFQFNKETNIYECQGKMFQHLESWEGMNELKQEIGQLLTYLSPALKEVHHYFSHLEYQLMKNYEYVKEDEINDNKQKVNFDEKIHAIVKVAEIEIKPNSVYTGQWHVEGFSSDNILYTCLYVIEQDENLVDGKLKFKRCCRSDDVPADPMSQPQCAHQYCPNYEYLCDSHKVIPLGSLDIKESMMVIFPNQNIHKVKGISNNTDKPLKRKIVAFFVVNNVDQPFTVNDFVFNAPLEKIKQYRLRDMYERSKNKQTDTQSFNYCEH